MIRVVLACIAIWGLVGAPVVCAGGILTHACDCGDETACEHEEDCSSDPCGQVGISLERPVTRHCIDKDGPVDRSAIDIAGTVDDFSMSGPTVTRCATPPSSDQPRPLFPSGNHPLLI